MHIDAHALMQMVCGTEIVLDDAISSNYCTLFFVVINEGKLVLLQLLFQCKYIATKRIYNKEVILYSLTEYYVIVLTRKMCLFVRSGTFESSFIIGKLTKA